MSPDDPPHAPGRPRGAPRPRRAFLALALLALGAVSGCALPGDGDGEVPPTAATNAGRATPRQAVRERAPIDGGELSYVDLGHGPAVILLHAGNVDLRLWDDDVLPLLDAGYRVIRYDLRGAGRSTLAAGPFQHQDDLRVLLDHLDLPRAILVGASLGGRVALDFAVEHPDRTEALVLLAPGLSGYDWSTHDLGWFEPIFTAMLEGDQETAARLWLESPYLEAAMEDPAVAERVTQLVLNNAFQWTPSVFELPLAPPAAGRLDQVRAPTLLLIGTRDVPGMLDIADRLEAGVPGLRRHDVDGAGHLLNLEAPRVFHDAVLAFLDRHAPVP